MVFKDRLEAGKKLAEEVALREFKDPIVLGVPRGGVPVGYCVAKKLRCPLDTVVLRKLPIPYSPEAGFGAVTLDRILVLNEPLVQDIGLSKPVIEKVLQEVYEEVLRRNKVYRGSAPFPELKGRSVILTDDGLASGFTMLAAVEFVKRRKPAKTIVASPVASESAEAIIRPAVDELIVLHVSHELFFAVANFYESFPDMEDSEVVEFLNKARKFTK